MLKFSEVLEEYDWSLLTEEIYNCTTNDVEKALSDKRPTLDGFKALISPAAEPYLEQMAQRAKELTSQRFGETIQMYIPLYLSNECQNICTYCGFSYNNPIERITLNDRQILDEVKVIKSHGYDHVLLVTGEANKSVGVSYFKNAIRLVKPWFANVSMEVQPLMQDEYETLREEGLHSVLVYQETYNKQEYKKHHPKGKKSNFDFRLDTPERLGKAGIHKMGLGVLLGLEDWRVDSFFCALHLDYLEKRFWKTKYSVSFPRLRPCSGGVDLKSNISDKQLLQLICAYRIFNQEIEISLSTRENKDFRDNVMGIGVTTVSAGSKTDPGGYSLASNELEQFDIDDKRSPQEVANSIMRKGYEPVWKDWDASLQ